MESIEEVKEEEVEVVNVEVVEEEVVEVEEEVEEEKEEKELPVVNLTPPAEGIKSIIPDHEPVVIEEMPPAIPEYVTKDHDEAIEQVVPETEIIEHPCEPEVIPEEPSAPLEETPLPEKEDLTITNVSLPIMKATVEERLDSEVLKEVIKPPPPVEEPPLETPKPDLKLDLPEPFEEFVVPEKPKAYMDDGEEIREMRPGFQDLGNCKRFWKANQLMGTRKSR